MAAPAVCVPYVAAAKNHGLATGLVLGSLVVATTAVLLWLLLPRPTLTLYMTAPLHRTATLTPQAHASRFPMRLALPDSLAGVVDTLAARYLMVPAIYSVPDEGYVIKMRLGRDNVLVVLDSGSANLSVGTADCVKAELCSAHDGAYRPEASPHAINLRQPANLQYASLAVDAHWWRDAAALPFVSADKCRDAPPRLEAARDEALLPALLPVAAAARMDGTASNILGLMGDHPAHTDPPVLEHMLTALRLPRRWSLAAYADGSGYLILGDFPSTCFPSVTLRHVPMSTAFSYMGAPCVDIMGMRWRDPVADAWHAVPHGAFPRHAVLDTGTSVSYATRTASAFAALAGLPHANALVPPSAIEALPDIEIELRNGLKVVYGPKHYMLPAGSGSMRTTICCGDDKVDALFGDAPVFLVGIHHMSGWLLDVDLARARVGFGRLPTPAA